MGARKFGRFAPPFSRLIGRGLTGRLMDFCGFAKLNLNLRFAAALFLRVRALNLRPNLGVFLRRIKVSKTRLSYPQSLKLRRTSA